VEFMNTRSPVTYTCVNLFFDRADYFVDAAPLVLILGAALNHAEALQNVDYVINASALDSKLLRALVQVQQTALWNAVEEEESATELP